MSRRTPPRIVTAHVESADLAVRGNGRQGCRKIGKRPARTAASKQSGGNGQRRAFLMAAREGRIALVFMLLRWLVQSEAHAIDVEDLTASVIRELDPPVTVAAHRERHLAGLDRHPGGCVTGASLVAATALVPDEHLEAAPCGVIDMRERLVLEPTAGSSLLPVRLLAPPARSRRGRPRCGRAEARRRRVRHRRDAAEPRAARP